MTTTAHEDQFTVAPESVRQPYDAGSILRRNVADLEIALKRQTERAEAAEAELLAVREDNHSMMVEIDGLRKELAKLREQEPVVMPRFCDDATSGLETMVLWLEMLSRGECYARSKNLVDDSDIRKATIRDAMKYADMCLKRIRPALAELNRFAIEYCGTAADHGFMDVELYAAPIPTPAVPDIHGIVLQLTLAETEMLNAKAWSAGNQAKRHIDFAMTAICCARALLQSAEVRHDR